MSWASAIVSVVGIGATSSKISGLESGVVGARATNVGEGSCWKKSVPLSVPMSTTEESSNLDIGVQCSEPSLKSMLCTWYMDYELSSHVKHLSALI